MLRMCRAGAAAGGSIALRLRVKVLVTDMAMSLECMNLGNLLIFSKTQVPPL